MHSLGSISAIASEKKIFLYFPIWSCVNIMTCGGGHLGIQIITKNTNLIRDHSIQALESLWCIYVLPRGEYRMFFFYIDY
jgi:hypothetical protein